MRQTCRTRATGNLPLPVVFLCASPAKTCRHPKRANDSDDIAAVSSVSDWERELKGDRVALILWAIYLRRHVDHLGLGRPARYSVE